MVKGTKKKKGFIVLEPENVKKGRGSQPSLLEPHALNTLGGRHPGGSCWIGLVS